VGISIPQLQEQIQRNCDISDANYAGLYSLCGLLLRMRDLYKWEQGLRPWQEPEPAELLEWVDDRESRWEAISSSELQPITVGNERFEPFDMAAIHEAGRERPTEWAKSQIISNLIEPLGIAGSSREDSGEEE